MNQRTTLDKLIYALAMMLILAVLALTGMKIYKHVVLPNGTPPSNMIEHNIIKEEGSNSGVDGKGEDEGQGKEEVKVSGNTTKENQGYLVETSNEAAVNFYEMHMNYNERFHLENMFPGDAYSKGYAVTVNHIGPIDVTFKVVADPDSYLLSNALRVKMIYNDTVIHEGSLQDFTYTARINSNTERRDVLDYKVQVYLPTSAGNELQEEVCNADFYWTADEVIDETTGETGKLVPDTSSFLSTLTENDFLYYGLIAIILGIVCILMWGKRHEER